MRCIVFVLMLPLAIAVNAAEFQRKKPVKILELNEKTLLHNIWPGMTIKQAIQILGDPEEIISVQGAYKDNSAQAVRYGQYWLIPQKNGVQIECVIHQKGFRSYDNEVYSCYNIDDKFKLATQ